MSIPNAPPRLQDRQRVKLRQDVLGHVENDAGVLIPFIIRNGTIVQIEIYRLQDKNRDRTPTSLSLPEMEYVYGLARNEGRTWTRGHQPSGVYIEHQTIPHAILSPSPNGQVSDKFYRRNQLVHLLESLELNPKTAQQIGRPQIQPGEAVYVSSNQYKSAKGGIARIPSKAYYNFQTAVKIEGPKVWRSDHYYPTSAFRVLN